jgi:hypothetical protein
VSYDCSTRIFKYDATTGAFLGSFPWSGTGCYNSGVAIGGDLLFQGSDGCSHVWVIKKDTLTPSFDFTTIVAGDPNFRDESLTCDPFTFRSTLGKQVMWSKEAYSPMRAHAFEVPTNTCGSGGLPAGNSCPLTHGFWKNHPSAWPLTTLILGGRAYTEAQLLTILATPPRGDASVILAYQLIAAKLNIANASDPTPINLALAAADTELSVVGPLPAGVSTDTALGQAMTATAATLDQYNNGQLTPQCTVKVP